MFDDGYAPGSQWSVLMMEFLHEFLFSSFDGEITVPLIKDTLLCLPSFFLLEYS